MRRTVSETTETIEINTSERSKVESWRLHVLIEAGYPLPLAERLAGSEADLHLAVALVENGCEHQTAAEILLRSEETRLNSSHVAISYAVFCLKKKKHKRSTHIDKNNSNS